MNDFVPVKKPGVEMPEFPQVRVSSRPRGGFTVTEYAHLLRKARSLVGRLHPVAETLRPEDKFWVARDLLAKEEL